MGYVPADPGRAKRLREAEDKIRRLQATEPKIEKRGRKKGPEAPHGTAARAHSCRCRECKEAQNAYQRDRYDRKKKRK